MVDKSRNRIELYPLGKIKGDIINMICENQDCVDLILGENNADLAKGYDVEDILLGNKKLSLDGQIKDRLVMLETQYQTKTYVFIDTYVSNAETTTIKTINIVIDVFTHLSSIDLSPTEKIKFQDKGFYGNRVDVLLDGISRMFNKKEGLGIGLTLFTTIRPMKIIQPTKDHYGRSTTYEIKDF